MFDLVIITTPVSHVSTLVNHAVLIPSVLLMLGTEERSQCSTHGVQSVVRPESRRGQPLSSMFDTVNCNAIRHGLSLLTVFPCLQNLIWKMSKNIQRQWEPPTV